MTREEAIKVLNGIRHLNYRNFWDEECDEAIDIAIKALSEDKTDRMTREEAIADIKNNIKPVVGGKSLDMAIEALSPRRRKDATEEDYAYCDDCEAVEMCMWYPYDGCIFKIQSRPKGEWKCMADCGVTECDQCGWNVEEYVGDYNYCPNCGADMRGEKC